MENEKNLVEENSYVNTLRSRVDSSESFEEFLSECKLELEENAIAIKLLDSCKVILGSNETLSESTREKTLSYFEDGFAIAYSILISSEESHVSNDELSISFFEVGSELIENANSMPKPDYQHELATDALDALQYLSDEGFWDVPGLDGFLSEIEHQDFDAQVYRNYFRSGVGMIGKVYHYFTNEESLENRHIDTGQTEFGKLFKSAEYLVSRRTGTLASIRGSMVFLARSSEFIDEKYSRDYLPHVVATGLSTGYAAGSILYDNRNLEETRAETGPVLKGMNEYIEDLATVPRGAKVNYRHLLKGTETFLADKHELHSELIEHHKRIYLRAPVDIKDNMELQKLFLVCASIGARIFSDSLELRRYISFVSNDYAFDELIRQIVYTSTGKQVGGESSESDE